MQFGIEVWNRREENRITRTGIENQIGNAQGRSSSWATKCC